MGSVGHAGRALPGTVVQPQEPSSRTLTNDQDRTGCDAETPTPKSVSWTVLGVMTQRVTPG